MCVLICLLSRDGRSKALRHTSQGNKVRSPRNGLGLAGVTCTVFTLWSTDAVSPDSELAEDDDSAPDSDFRSSVSSTLGGDEADDADDVPKALDNSDMDRSNGESEAKKRNCFIFLAVHAYFSKKNLQGALIIAE